MKYKWLDVFHYDVTPWLPTQQKRISKKKIHLMAVSYYFTAFYDVYVWLYSPRAFSWFVLERKYAKERGSSHENSWLKCKMLWTEHEAVGACLFHGVAPSPHRAGEEQSPGADESCPLDVWQLTLLPGEPVLLLPLIWWHFSTKSQGGSAARPEAPVTMSLSILRMPRSRLVPIPPPSLQPTPAPLAGHPSSLTQQAQICISGVREEAAYAHTSHPSSGDAPSQRVTAGTRPKRCSRTGHCTVTQHTPMPSTGRQCCTIYWIGQGLKKNERSRLFCQKNYTFRGIYVLHIHIHTCICVWVCLIYR